MPSQGGKRQGGGQSGGLNAGQVSSLCAGSVKEFKGIVFGPWDVGPAPVSVEVSVASFSGVPEGTTRLQGPGSNHIAALCASPCDPSALLSP